MAQSFRAERSVGGSLVEKWNVSREEEFPREFAGTFFNPDD
jgi:hypothetical protein